MSVGAYECTCVLVQTQECGSTCGVRVSRVCVPSSLHHSPWLPSRALRPHWPLNTHRTSTPPQLHAPCCSLHQCVLDQEKLRCPGGPLYLVPTPAHCAVLLAWGGFSPALSTICCFPKSLRVEALRGVPGGGSPGPAPAPHLPHSPVGPVLV